MEEVNTIEYLDDANINDTIDIKIAPFGPDVVFEFIDEYETQKWALKALAHVVIEVDFGKYVENEGLRLGLGQLIDMCIKKQEKIIDKLEERVKNSPEDILVEAKAVSRLITRGCPPQTWYTRGLVAIKRLEELISLSDIEDYPEATQLKNKLLSGINQQKDNKSNNILPGTNG